MPISMLFGSHAHTVDAKGRINIPASFRELIGDNIVITQSVNQALVLYSPTEWVRFIEQFFQGDEEDHEILQQYFMGNAHTDCCDKQGRITLPSRLLSYGGIEKNIMVVGMGNRIEIWDAELWSQRMNSLNPADIRNKMKGARF